jgi:general secretion pathway protein I
MSAEHPGGFTLLEVLVALAIAGLALVVLFRAGGEGLVAVDTALRAEQAAERARSHLAAVGHGMALTAGDFSGEDGGGYRWHLRLVPIAHLRSPATSDVRPVATTLFEVEVSISWVGRGRDRAVVLKSYRLATASTAGG